MSSLVAKVRFTQCTVYTNICIYPKVIDIDHRLCYRITSSGVDSQPIEAYTNDKADK